MKRLDADALVALRARFARLTPDSRRRWGVMTPEEMLAHLADSFLAALGERRVRAADNGFTRGFMKWAGLTLPLPWPPGIPTRPEVDPRRAGTRPGEFDAERERLLTALQRFAERPPEAAWGRHPLFGPMTHAEWMRWGWLHADHHLRQFGV